MGINQLKQQRTKPKWLKCLPYKWVIVLVLLILSTGAYYIYKDWKNDYTIEYLYDNSMLSTVEGYSDGMALVCGGDSIEVEKEVGDLLFTIGHREDGFLNVTSVNDIYSFKLYSSYIVQSLELTEDGYNVVACDTSYTIGSTDILLSVYLAEGGVFNIVLNDSSSTEIEVSTLPNAEIIECNEDGIYTVEVNNNYLLFTSTIIYTSNDSVPKDYYYSEDNGVLLKNE